MLPFVDVRSGDTVDVLCEAGSGVAEDSTRGVEDSVWQADNNNANHIKRAALYLIAIGIVRNFIETVMVSAE